MGHGVVRHFVMVIGLFSPHISFDRFFALYIEDIDVGIFEVENVGALNFKSNELLRSSFWFPCPHTLPEFVEVVV